MLWIVNVPGRHAPTQSVTSDNKPIKKQRALSLLPVRKIEFLLLRQTLYRMSHHDEACARARF